MDRIMLVVQRVHVHHGQMQQHVIVQHHLGHVIEIMVHVKMVAIMVIIIHLGNNNDMVDMEVEVHVIKV
jgi:hypothetical protein